MDGRIDWSMGAWIDDGTVDCIQLDGMLQQCPPIIIVRQCCHRRHSHRSANHPQHHRRHRCHTHHRHHCRRPSPPYSSSLSSSITVVTIITIIIGNTILSGQPPPPSVQTPKAFRSDVTTTLNYSASVFLVTIPTLRDFYNMFKGTANAIPLAPKQKQLNRRTCKNCQGDSLSTLRPSSQDVQ